MKKFLISTLFSLFSVAVFASPFSKIQFSKLSPKDRMKYAYQSEVSSESNILHIANYFFYQNRVLNKNYNKQQVDQILQNNFFSKSPKFGKQSTAIAYSIFEIDDPIVFQYSDSVQQYFKKLYSQQKYKEISELSVKDNFGSACHYIIRSFQKTKDYNGLWEYCKRVLLTAGGIKNIQTANTLLTTMFQYKPRTISKEQQIAFIEQLSQMYPVPGTDFTQWKGFMGFLGYKYKALTGKDLFPESK